MTLRMIFPPRTDYLCAGITFHLLEMQYSSHIKFTYTFGPIFEFSVCKIDFSVHVVSPGNLLSL